MAIIRKYIEVEAKIGDIIKAPFSIFREDLTLYICYIEGDLLYISPEKDSPKEDCETTFSDDCFLL
jgi:adenine-specific DNA methylase